MPAPSVFDVVKDPEFHALPYSEKRKVLQKIDPDYAGLSNPEQVTALDGIIKKYGKSNFQMGSELKQSHAPQLKQAHETAEPSRFERTMKESARVLSPVARFVLEGGGATAGAIAGAAGGVETGPGAIATTVLGAGLGYSSGKQAADWLDEYAGLKEPPDTAMERYTEAAKDVGVGASFEVGGQLLGKAIVPIFRGGKWVFNTAKGGIQKMLTKEGAEKAASEIFVANTSEGAIFAKNAEEAAQIEKEIPGLKFTMGQRTNDPKLIKLERTQMRGPGTAAQQNAEQIASNNEALRAYYAKTFPGEENVDDLIKGLKAKKAELSTTEQTATAEASGQTEAIPKAEPQETGQKLVETLQGKKETVKEQASELYKKVPPTEIPIENMLKQFDEISQPMSKFEKPGNVPEILNTVKEALAAEESTANIATMSLDDLQGLRSELLSQARQARASQTPNERLASRLSKAAKAVEETITSAETGSAELKAANKFFRENYAEVFKQGTIGDILRRGPRGETTRMPLAQIPGKIWNTRNTAAVDDLIKAVGKDDAKTIMSDHAAYELMQNATNADGHIVSNKLYSWLNKNKVLLKKLGIEGQFNKIGLAQRAVDQAVVASREFEKSAAARLINSDPEKAIANAIKGSNTAKATYELMEAVKGDKTAIKGLKNAFADHIMDIVQTTSKDIANKPTISNAFMQRTMKKYMPAMKQLYKADPGKLGALKKMQRAYEIAIRNTRSPIGGGSDTAENILTEISKANFLSRKVAIAKRVAKYFTDIGENAANEIVNRAIFDPDYAKLLTDAFQGKIKPEQLNRVQAGKIIPLDQYRQNKIAAAAAGVFAVSNNQ